MSEQPSSKERATTATNEINEMNSNNETRQAAPKPSSKTRLLLDRAVDAMAALHRAFEPMEDVDGIPAMVSPEAVRTFVDTLAEIDYQRCRLGDDVPPSVTSLCSRTALDAFLTQYWPQLELRERDDLTKEAAPPADDAKQLLREAAPYIESFAQLTKHPTAPADARVLIDRIYAYTNARGAPTKSESPEPGRSQSSGLSASPDAENIGRPSHDESQCWEPCGALGKSEEHARVATEKSAALEDVTGKPACPSCGWVAGHADYCGRSTVETSSAPSLALSVDSGRPMTLRECMEAEDGIPFQPMEANTDPLTHQEIFSAVHHHASEIVRLTAAVPTQCTAESEEPSL